MTDGEIAVQGTPEQVVNTPQHQITQDLMALVWIRAAITVLKNSKTHVKRLIAQRILQSEMRHP